MTSFETIASMLAARSPGLSTGLPQLDRAVPLGPGHLAVLIGASGVGKTRVAQHIAETVKCTHERGAVTITRGHLTIDDLDATVTYRRPALVIIDPLTTLASRANPNNDNEYIMQFPIYPRELGELGEQLKAMARRHRIPLLVCHRYTPIRDSITGEIVSTESANPLLDQADFVGVVRVLADPHQVGLEIVRNRLGRTANLRLPLPAIDDSQGKDGGPSFVPVPRMPLART